MKNDPVVDEDGYLLGFVTPAPLHGWKAIPHGAAHRYYELEVQARVDVLERGLPRRKGNIYYPTAPLERQSHMSFMEHPDPEVRQAIVALSDRLCTWERNTGRESVLIVREQGGFVYRANSGKPGIPDDIPDQQLLDAVR